ncbi:MAG: AGE family epimerase/isomerase [Bacteroidales bacterium]|nr:AGE family epimerase/isomerase [Bacteroidales bacterium]
MTRTEIFRQEILDTLQNNILHFWIARMQDPRGGFYGRMTGEGEIQRDADRGVVLNARLLWTFSAAYRHLGDKQCLIAAMDVQDWFLRHFVDHKFGGVYWSVQADGSRKDAKKQLYAQAFAIYAFSEYYAATGDDQALKEAVNLYHVVEKFFADAGYGGYIEALDRDFSPLDDMSLSAHDRNADKTMNSHLHLLEAYANLYKVWPDAQLGQKTADLLTLLTDRIMDRETGHLQLYFTRDWGVIPAGCSYGHDIETSWLMLEAAASLRDIDIMNRIRPIARRIGEAGLEGLQPDGSLIYEKHEDGSLDDSRQWWVQAETVVGNLWLWKYHGLETSADTALHTWGYIQQHLLHPEGEWWWACDAEGQPDTAGDRAGFWKCPYHNTRMCLQVLEVI